jgi:hypothetical protein
MCEMAFPKQPDKCQNVLFQVAGNICGEKLQNCVLFVKDF